MNPSTPAARLPIVLAPGEGRAYPMGRISAVFKADGPESDSRYSISEWWLDPHTQGPGAHAHPEDDIFYVIEGTMSVLVDGKWIDSLSTRPVESTMNCAMKLVSTPCRSNRHGYTGFGLLAYGATTLSTSSLE